MKFFLGVDDFTSKAFCATEELSNRLQLVDDRGGDLSLESVRLTLDLLGPSLGLVVIWFVFGFWVA